MNLLEPCDFGEYIWEDEAKRVLDSGIAVITLIEELRPNEQFCGERRKNIQFWDLKFEGLHDTQVGVSSRKLGNEENQG